MQTKTLRGVRRLLVATGAITLVIAAVAPATASAAKPDRPEQGRAGGPGNGDQLVGEDAEHPSQGERVTVCHHTGSLTNEVVVIEVDENATRAGRGHAEHHDGDDEFDLDGEVSCDDEIEEGDQELDGAPGQSGNTPVVGGPPVDGPPAGPPADLPVGPPVDAPVGPPADVPVGPPVVEDPPVDAPVGPPVGDGPPVDGGAGDVADELLDASDEAEAEPLQTVPATTSQPVPSESEPVIEISADSTEAEEVLGVTTTRTPTPGVPTLESGVGSETVVASLPVTGPERTPLMVLAGMVLLFAGLGLEVVGRRRRRSAMVLTEADLAG